MLFRRDLWRSLVQLFAQRSNNFKVRSGCPASHPAKFQKSQEGGHTGSLENLLKCLIILMVKILFLVLNQKSLAATFNCCLLCSYCVPLSLCCSSLWPLFRWMALGFSSAFFYGQSCPSAFTHSGIHSLAEDIFHPMVHIHGEDAKYF